MYKYYLLNPLSAAYMCVFLGMITWYWITSEGFILERLILPLSWAILCLYTFIKVWGLVRFPYSHRRANWHQLR